MKAEVDENVEQCDETVDKLVGCKTDETGEGQIAREPKIGSIRR